MEYPKYLLDRLVPVGVSKDGRRMDFSAVSARGTITIGPEGDEASFHPIEALWLIARLPGRYQYFRGSPAGRGGRSRLRIEKFERVPLRKVLGIPSRRA